MKDIVGNELSVGDYVVSLTRGQSCISVARVVGITKQNVWAGYLTGSNNDYFSVYLTNQVCRISPVSIPAPELRQLDYKFDEHMRNLPGKKRPVMSDGISHVMRDPEPVLRLIDLLGFDDAIRDPSLDDIADDTLRLARARYARAREELRSYIGLLP